METWEEVKGGKNMKRENILKASVTSNGTGSGSINHRQDRSDSLSSFPPFLGATECSSCSQSGLPPIFIPICPQTHAHARTHT